MIMGAGFTLGPFGMGKALTYISLETGWILVGFVALVCTVLMYWVEKYDEHAQKAVSNQEVLDG